MSLQMDLLNPTDLEQYETHIRRLRYDDRDCIMYENMLHFLWDFVIGKKDYEPMEEIYEEYSFWNHQMIKKVLYQDHAHPYANIQRCYQSIIELLRQKPQAGRECIDAIGKESFSYDGLAPKIRMDASGRIFRPMSKLFVLYNYAKYYEKHGMKNELEALKNDYPFAFTQFDDEEHRAHDLYYKEQMEVLQDKIVYPIEEKVYKIPWGPKDFYLYFDENSYIAL
ncbi:MAG: hypothetical protein Q4E53_09215 [Eubacteriales bacterium]|nr:hypothetical protein [Eubacteriales bacterium]